MSKREPALLAALEAEIVAFESREVSRPPAFGEPLDVDAMECYRRSAQGGEPRLLYRPDPDEEVADTPCLEVK